MSLPPASYTLEGEEAVYEAAFWSLPDNWPHLYLPVKRNTQGEAWPLMGCVMPADVLPVRSGKVRILDMNLFDPPPVMPASIAEYDSVAEAIADGWRSD